jgi:predicted negative regulator of RcsB-dependent stress response
VARITRKELKTDNFALEIEHTVSLFEEHRKEILRYGGAALAVILVVVGVLIYNSRQHAAREQALAAAIAIQEASVGPPAAPGLQSFPTQDAKDAAAIKAFTEVKNQYGSSAEGEIAQYYLGDIQADQGKFPEAEKSYNEVAQHGDAKYSALAKFSLAQIYFADGKDSQGEAILRDQMAHPTVYVSKEQATVMLARMMAPKRRAEALKLLDPLRNQPGTVGQVVLQLYSEISAQGQ